jgi:hypothetical protein
MSGESLPPIRQRAKGEGFSRDGGPKHGLQLEVGEERSAFRQTDIFPRRKKKRWSSDETTVSDNRCSGFAARRPLVTNHSDKRRVIHPET